MKKFTFLVLFFFLTNCKSDNKSMGNKNSNSYEQLKKNFLIELDYIGNEEENLKKTLRKIVCTPAGRKVYLEILFKHLKSQKKDFDEWHLWINTQNQEDISYMYELANEYDWIKLIIPRDSNPAERNENIHRFYKVDSTALDAIYIRLDDDIVFLSKNFLKKLFYIRQTIRQPFLIYANIINNAVITALHQESKTFRYDDPIEFSASGNGWFNPSIAINLHNSFIVDLFAGNIQKWEKSFNLISVNDFRRVSVNAISWLGEDYHKFNGMIRYDEEAYQSEVLPRTFNRPNAIFGSAIAVHYAFFTQRNDIDKTNILNLYKKYADENL